MTDNKKLYIGAYILNKSARTKKHIEQIKNAEIDFMVSIDYNDTATLDLLEKYSVGAIVNGVFPSWWGSDGEKSGKMSDFIPMEKYDDCIKKYVPHKAVWGIDVGDEISCRDFDYVNKILEKHSNFFKDKFMYMNLYPNYAVHFESTDSERKKQWGTSSYRDYVEKYCQKIKLPYICFDHYPYCHNDMHKFIDNLMCVREMADKYNKSVYLVAQTSSYDKDAPLNRTHLLTQAYTALAFNVKVIMWACYSGGWWHNHVIDENGNKTALYDDVAFVNHEIKNFYKVYSGYDVLKVHILNAKSLNVSCFKNIRASGKGEYAVCELKNLQNGKTDAIYVVNIKEGANDGNLSFSCSKSPSLYCEDAHSKIMPDKADSEFLLKLSPGYGAIIKTDI